MQIVSLVNCILKRFFLSLLLIKNSENVSINLMMRPSIIETTGFDKNVTFNFANTEIIGRFSPNSGVSLDSDIDVCFDLSNVSIFDKKTELRI